MYRINITINENKENNILSRILWGNQTNKQSAYPITTQYLLSKFLTAVFKTFILKAERRLTTQFREISKLQDRGLNITIALKFGKQICGNVAKITVEFLSDAMIIILHLAVSRVHIIVLFAVRRLTK